jgi:hypothetical protein
MLQKINWKYAIGEIAIVIIGITIAFALNNFADDKKDRQAKKQYLQSIVADLDNEKNHLEDNISLFKSKISIINSLFPYLYGKKDGRDSVHNNIFLLAQIVHLNKHDVTYKTLVNSGDLGLFNDFDLKKALENHYSVQSAMALDYKRQNAILENHLGYFMIENMDFYAVHKGDYG